MPQNRDQRSLHMHDRDVAGYNATSLVKRVLELKVEVPGIEPGSSVALPGLLRAQSAMPLLDPTDHAN